MYSKSHFCYGKPSWHNEAVSAISSASIRASPLAQTDSFMPFSPCRGRTSRPTSLQWMHEKEGMVRSKMSQKAKYYLLVDLHQSPSSPSQIPDNDEAPFPSQMVECDLVVPIMDNLNNKWWLLCGHHVGGSGSNAGHIISYTGERLPTWIYRPKRHSNAIAQYSRW